jgi:hypothetical protein
MSETHHVSTTPVILILKRPSQEKIFWEIGRQLEDNILRNSGKTTRTTYNVTRPKTLLMLFVYSLPP